MTTKNKIVVLLSIVHFLTVLVAILKSFGTLNLFGTAIAPIWIVIWSFTFLLPIINLAAIINNRDSWNLFYWLGLFFNILAIAFIIRHHQIDLF